MFEVVFLLQHLCLNISMLSFVLFVIPSIVHANIIEMGYLDVFIKKKIKSKMMCQTQSRHIMQTYFFFLDHLLSAFVVYLQLLRIVYLSHNT